MSRRLAALVALGALAACAPRCRIDPARGSGTLFAWVLGRLDEYDGRLVLEDDDFLTAIGASEEADDLVGALHALAREQGLRDDVRVEPREGGGRAVYAHCLGRALNAFSTVRFTRGIKSRGADGAYHRTARVVATPALVAGWTLDARLAYVAGARAARHDGDVILLANAHEKAQLLADSLVLLGATGVHVDSAFGIPRVDRVRFEGPAVLREALRHWSPAAHAPLGRYGMGATIPPPG